MSESMVNFASIDNMIASSQAKGLTKKAFLEFISGMWDTIELYGAIEEITYEEDYFEVVIYDPTQIEYFGTDEDKAMKQFRELNNMGYAVSLWKNGELWHM
jgi:hypothetical protein